MEKQENSHITYQPRPVDQRMEQHTTLQTVTQGMESPNYLYVDRPNTGVNVAREDGNMRHHFDRRVFQEYSFPYSDSQYASRTGSYDHLQHLSKTTFMQPFANTTMRRGFTQIHNKDQNICFSSFNGYSPFPMPTSVQNTRQENSILSDNSCKESSPSSFTRSVDSSMCKETNATDMSGKCSELHDSSLLFTCGGCRNVYNSICKLHEHLDLHIEGGSYIYNHRTKTAFPTHDTSCSSTQTDNEDDVTAAEIESNENITFEEHSLNNSKSENLTDSTIDHTSIKIDTCAYDINSSLITVGKDVSENVERIEADIFVVKIEPKEEETNHYSSDTDVEVKYDHTEEKEEKHVKKKKAKQKHASIKDRRKLRKHKHETGKKSHLRSKQRKVKKIEGVSKEINCGKCEKVFRFNIELKRHMRACHAHTEDNYCSRCREKFESEAAYLEHKKVHIKGRYECEECHQILTTAKLLEDHINRHTGNKPYPCDICGKSFRTKGQMNFHKKQYHCPSYIQQCEYCGKVFTCRYKMKDHVRYCLGIKPYKCEVCDKGFIRSTHLIQHMRLHTGERMYVCDQCGLNLSSQSSLKKHRRIHSGERPFQCDVCNMAFSAKSTLVDHRRTHTQDKRFACSYCGRSFIKKWNLKTHLRQHTGETPYKCDVCGQGFKQNVLLRTHIQSHDKPDQDQSVLPSQQGSQIPHMQA